MKILALSLLATPVVVIACGGFFYPAPPTLDRFPERLPGKTMRELLRETTLPPAEAATFDQLLEETRAIAALVGTAPRNEVLARIEKTLSRNRTGDYRKRFSNCLYDFHDLLTGEGAPIPEISAYTAWRVNAMEWDDGFFRKATPANAWQFSEEELAQKRRNWERELKDKTEFVAEQIAKAAPGLKPHWLVQAGAWQFKHGQFADAARLFQQAIDAAPQHPRAEVALLMMARTRMEEWREVKTPADEKELPPLPEIRNKLQVAEQALDTYLEKFPQGRFAADIPGWRAGLAREQGFIGAAIELFLQQMDDQAHPEIVRRAVRECEACLDALDAVKIEEEDSENPGATSLPLAEIARRPLATLAVVYHFLDAESRRDFDNLLERSDSVTDRDVTQDYLLPMLKLRRAGRLVLPALAEAVAKNKGRYDEAHWQPRYLAILAWAASEAGEHRQAIRLCELGGDATHGSDDLQFVLAVALQRNGDLDKAIEAFRALQQRFPDSPLNADSRFRIATALRDKQEAGAAVVEMMRIAMGKIAQERARQQLPADELPGPRTIPDLHIDAEIQQWCDTLLQFAPLSELERGLSVPNLEGDIARRLRAILRQRFLAREDFSAAQRFAEPAAPAADDAPVVVWPSRFLDGNYFPSEWTGEAWQNAIGNLSRLTREASATSKVPGQAAKLWALAEAWESARGRLLLSSADDYGMLHNEFYQTWTQRQANARYAGFAKGAAAELESRDELQHAYRYYLAAAEATPGTPLAARALFRANETLRKIAELSPWSSAHAFETNAAADSKALHERLRRESPQSEEAKRIVWWTFPPPAELAWMPGDHPNYDVEVEVAKTFQKESAAIQDFQYWDSHPDFLKRLGAIASQAETWDIPRLISELSAVRHDFLPVFAGPHGARIINHLDDLELFLREPGVTPSVGAKYFAARLSDAPPNVDDPELQPWRDYLAFLALVREKPISYNRQTDTAIHRPMSQRMREFLEAYPRSHKREAALARFALATVRETRGHTGAVTTQWPEAPKLGGYKAIRAQRDAPFDAQSVLAVLDRYDREYPKGRYAAEMRLWRGALAVDTGNWKQAVTLLNETLDDSSKRDLHLDAALNLADVFMRLLEQPENRMAIIAALQENPPARQRLRQFMQSKTPGARLRCLEGYLEAAKAL